MAGYTEVLQTMAAMVIFSLILLSANRMIQRNTMIQVEGEMEQEVIALANNIIQESRTMEFDEKSMGGLPPVNIPGGFTENSSLGPEGESGRSQYDDFDDYNGWSESMETRHGMFDVWAQVFYVTSSFDSTGSKTTFKKIRVFISSKFLQKNPEGERTQYQFEFVRNYYAD